MLITRRNHFKTVDGLYRSIELLVDENMELVLENEKLKQENYKIKNAHKIKAVSKATKTPPTKRVVKKETK